MNRDFKKPSLYNITFSIFLFFTLITNPIVAYTEELYKIDIGNRYFYYQSMLSEPIKVVVIQKYNDGDVKVRKPDGDNIIVSAKKLVSEKDNEIDFSSIMNGVNKIYELDKSHIYVNINNKCHNEMDIYIIFKDISTLEEKKLQWAVSPGKNTRLYHNGTFNFISYKYPYNIAIYNKETDEPLKYKYSTKLMSFNSKERLFFEKNGDYDAILCSE